MNKAKKGDEQQVVRTKNLEKDKAGLGVQFSG